MPIHRQTDRHTSCTTSIVLSCLLLAFASGCTLVEQNEVGVRRVNGKLKEKTLGPGRYATPPFTKILTLPVNTINLEVQLTLPSQEGLSVTSDISILYRIDPDLAHVVLRTAGDNYEDAIILSSFRSAAADVSARFMAKDMHSGARSQIEQDIKERMAELLNERGFIIEAVLMKSISLPVGLSRAIEDRLAAEQDAMRMQFVLEQERSEAERKMIEAKGQRDANAVINEQLSEKILRLRAIEAFLLLAESPNSKIIITDPRSPMHMTIDPVEESGGAPEKAP